MYILGISALYHDSAAALIKDGNIIAAVQEERFTRKKHDMGIPFHAIKYCMEYAGITSEDLECVVYYDNPIMTLDRFAKNALALGEKSDRLIARTFESMHSKKIWIHKEIEKAIGGLGKRGKLLVTEHHISHAASAFYPSPFTDAIILTVDGVGEWATTTIGVGHGREISLFEQISYPHSLGLLYSAFTYFCGFKVNSGDYKFMGLAPYGKPIYYEVLKKEIIDVKADGSYRLNLDYFDFQNGGTMIQEDKFAQLFGGGRRKPEEQITRREMDIAASVQKLTEEIILQLASHAKKVYGCDIPNIVLAGGCALNCVANGKLLREKIFDNIWIQPAAGDAGGALGAALYAYYMIYQKERHVKLPDKQDGSYLGPAYSVKEIKEYLDEKQYVYHEIIEMKDFYKRAAHELALGKVVGLFHGRMEYGPRALGNRSIVADPRSQKMQSKLNLKIKYRESFRPFAPAVLEERLEDYFELHSPSPYMLLVDQVKKERQEAFDLDRLFEASGDNMLPIVNEMRSDIPAVTHVDYSARIQTVNRECNEHFYNLIKSFEEETGCGVVVNTSFNVRGEPIVCTPEEACTCFMRTQMDVLLLENIILYKEEQNEWEEGEDWRNEYELD
ncbi:MAG: carbamoyltransferase [Lachnospiraceae bacterium]|nr:carbamoyltransferase [Lachnospiraceae bacterium]